MNEHTGFIWRWIFTALISGVCHGLIAMTVFFAPQPTCLPIIFFLCFLGQLCILPAIFFGLYADYYRKGRSMKFQGEHCTNHCFRLIKGAKARLQLPRTLPSWYSLEAKEVLPRYHNQVITVQNDWHPLITAVGICYVLDCAWLTVPKNLEKSIQRLNLP